MNQKPVSHQGWIAWMAKNHVAANLLMIVFIVGGLMVVPQVKQEVMPEFRIDIVTVSVPYPGASPEEVEKGINLAVEEGVRGLDGIKKTTTVANEGSGTTIVELRAGSDANKALQDIKNAVDRIQSFPQDSERPIVSLVTLRNEVISLVLYGDVEENALRTLTENVREELLAFPDITQVEYGGGVRPREIHVEVPQDTLRRYDLSLRDVAQAIRSHAVEIPAGGVKTDSGEVLLRTDERRDYASQFRDVPVVSSEDGGKIVLSDIATVVDGFRDTDEAAFFNGKPAMRLKVFRIGDEGPIELAATVKEYVKDLQDRLPPGIEVATWFDASTMFQERIMLLVKNAGLGLLLVLLILGLFLEPRLAMWVTLGIPCSILGAFLLFPSTDVSINMISLFAFIITLGIIVDDAVVVGENIFEYRQRGYNYVDAAIAGSREIAMPVTFSILTNIAAFTPMLFVPGVTGKFFFLVPVITISVFLVSLIESLYVLPSHLAYQKPASPRGMEAFVMRQQKKFADGLLWCIQHLYQPVLRSAVEFRYVTMAFGVAAMILSVGAVAGGHIKFIFFPKIDADIITATATLPFGSPIEETDQVQQQLVRACQDVIDDLGGTENVGKGILTFLGQGAPGRGPGDGDGASGSHITAVEVFLLPSDQRDFSALEFANLWRERVGEIAGLESLLFNASMGPGSGEAINLLVSHPSIATLETAAAELADRMSEYAGVKDVDDGFSAGKTQLNLKLKPEARNLGLTASDLAAQVRSSFYGERAFRQQRGREEIWVMVRLPEDERTSEYDIENLLISLPPSAGGGSSSMQGADMMASAMGSGSAQALPRREIPLGEAATIERSSAYTQIIRTDGRRTVNVTADVVEGVANPNEVLADIEATVIPELQQKYPGLQFSYDGPQQDQAESMGSLMMGFVMAMLVIYALLAVPFKSYFQPIIVMSAIPFGFIGAVIGHVIMGYDLSMISMFGLVALAGVVVNDSLVMVDAANRFRRNDGFSPFDSIIKAGMRRFRPILLTSLTTFFGLMPMIMETSMQARFLIPMAISLGFGIMFSTLIILFLVPALYMFLEDMGYVVGWEEESAEEAASHHNPDVEAPAAS